MINLGKCLINKGSMTLAIYLLTTLAANAFAQEYYKIHRGADNNLGFKIKARGSAYIEQEFGRTRRTPYVVVNLRSLNSYESPDNWSWEVANPSDKQLKNDLTFKWYGQASCPSSLTHLSVNGPGGQMTQNPLNNPVSGFFSYQSFDHENIKNICTNWANSNTCNPAVPGEPSCALSEEFNLIGGTAPVVQDMLYLSASCANGTNINKAYAPVMTLRCDRSGVF